MAVPTSSPLVSSPFSFLPTLASGTSFWPFAPFWPLAGATDEESSPHTPLTDAASAVSSAVNQAIETAQSAPTVA
ncbi:hypothetical protein AB4Y35_08860 [Paraburkholderia sp. EG286A]